MRCIIVLLIVAVLCLSCGKGDPVSPDDGEPGRQLMIFETPEEIFGGNYDYLDADAATIMNGCGTLGADQDTVWEDAEGHNWSVAVALEYDDTSDTAVVYRFLGDDIDFRPPVEYVPDLTGKIRFPRVASSFFVVTTVFVEVAIAYQYWDDTDSDWDIGVVRMGFDPDDFADYILENITDIEPDWVSDFEDDAVDLDTDLGISEIHPDIAYDPSNGNLWVVFSKSGLPGVWHIFINRGARYGANKDQVLWSAGSAKVAQNTDPESNPPKAHNGFHPRIDIGKVDLYEHSTLGWTTLIAYTGGREPGQPQGRWHVRVNYWPVNEVPDENEFENNWYIHDWEFDDYPGGVPMIDIAPQGSDFAALVWTQAKSDDWSNCTISYYDSKWGRYHQSDETDWGSKCTAFPSVAAHEHDATEYYYASVSYLLTENYVNEYWNPRGVRYQTYAVTETTIEWGDPVPVSDSVHGKWDPGGLVEHCLGMSTALTVMNDDYWMIWSGYEAGAGPDTVYGTYGDTSN